MPVVVYKVGHLTDEAVCPSTGRRVAVASPGAGGRRGRGWSDAMRAGWGAGLLLVLEGAARAAAFLAPAREAFSSSRQHHVLSWGATQRPSRTQSATIMTAVQTSLSFNAASAILPHPAKALTGRCRKEPYSIIVTLLRCQQHGRLLLTSSFYLAVWLLCFRR